MKKTRILINIAIAIMILSFNSISVKAETVIVDSGLCGTNLTWTLYSDGSLHITGEGAMDDYESETPWILYSDRIISVVIGNGVTRVGNNAFLDCTEIDNVDISASVKELGDFAFSGTAIESVYIPQNVVNIGKNPFCKCSKLKRILVSSKNSQYYSEDSRNMIIEFQTEKIIVGCNGSIMPSWAKSIGEYAFAFCDMKTIELPSYLETIENNAFYACNNLEEVICPENLMSIGREAFANCIRLENIYISDNVYYIGGLAFSGCTSLKCVTYTGINKILTNKLFDDCSKLEKIIIPGSNWEIDDCFFDGIRNDVVIKGTDVELEKYVKEKGYGFEYVKKIQFVFSNGNCDTRSKYYEIGLPYNSFPQVVPYLKNYVFLGWSTGSTSKTIISVDDIVSKSSASTLYAVVEKNTNKYDIIFEPMGGTCEQKTSNVAMGDMYGTLPIPVKDNSSFIGWYTDEVFGKKITSSTRFDYGKNQILYAHWSEPEYIISFNVCDGIHDEYYYTYSKKVKINSCYGALPNPTKIGYRFAGWYTSQNDGELVTDKTIFSDNKNVTLYAHWELESEPKLDSYSLSLGRYRIGMNIYLKELPTNVVKNGIVVINEKEYSIYRPCDDGTYKFTYYVSPKEIDDELTVSVYDENGTLVPIRSSKADNGKYVCTIRDYIEDTKDRNDSLGELTKAIGTYGGCSQKYFGYKEQNTVFDVDDINLESFKKIITGDIPEGITYLGSSLILNDSIAVRHYFNSTNNLEGITFILGNSIVEPKQINDNVYYVEKDDINSLDIATMFTVRVIDEEDTFVIKYCPLSYSYDAIKQGRDTELINLSKSIYWYGKASRDYFNISEDIEEDEEIISLEDTVEWVDSSCEVETRYGYRIVSRSLIADPRDAALTSPVVPSRALDYPSPIVPTIAIPSPTPIPTYELSPTNIGNQGEGGETGSGAGSDEGSPGYDLLPEPAPEAKSLSVEEISEADNRDEEVYYAQLTATASARSYNEDYPLMDKDGNQIYIRNNDGTYHEAQNRDYFDYGKTFYVKYTYDVGVYKGWQKIDGDTYYFDKNGTTVTGVQIIGGKRYFFRPDGVLHDGEEELGVTVTENSRFVDWEQVKKSGYTLAIIRCGYRENGKIVPDSFFNFNITEANRAGMNIALFFSSNAENETETEEEARFILEQIKGYNVNYPIYLQISAKDEHNELSYQVRTNAVNKFCEIIRENGYVPGIRGYKPLFEEELDIYQINAEIWADEPFVDSGVKMFSYYSGQVQGIDEITSLTVRY